MTDYGEKLAFPFWCELGNWYTRRGAFHMRDARVFFKVFWGNTSQCNLKVLFTIYYSDGSHTNLIVDTDPYEQTTYEHKRRTRNVPIHTEPPHHGKITNIRFCYFIHFEERSIPSQFSYFFADQNGIFSKNELKREAYPSNVSNSFRTYEISSDLLQSDADWIAHNYHAINLRPIFTKGNPSSPDHPKQYIHQHLDKVIHKKKNDVHGYHSIKVCVDDIDDYDFISHLIYAHQQGVHVQCLVDWRQMTLTFSDHYATLKRSGIELIGVACMRTADPRIEVDTDMHNKFIIFDMEDALVGSFNFTFGLWPNNWESGMTFSSQATSRLLDNIFQSVRGGVIQKYGINPRAKFNLLYTFGRHRDYTGYNYRPHHAIIHGIHCATSSIRIVLFIIGEMSDAGENIVDALINAKNRGVDVQMMMNGHVARIGSNSNPHKMADEIRRPVIPAVKRLQDAGVKLYLAYGKYDQPVPYSPIHAKYCVIDRHLVIDGSFNWYNTSLFSHDLVMVVDDAHVARSYLDEYDQIMREFRVYQGSRKVN